MKKAQVLNKEELYKAYIIKNNSLSKCSELFNVPVSTIRINVYNYGFKKSQELIHLGGRTTLDNLPEDEKLRRSEAQSIRSKKTRSDIQNDPERLEEFTKKQSESHKLSWSLKTDEELSVISSKLSEAQNRRTPEQKAEKLEKEIATKRANNSFRDSNPELEYYNYLVSKYGANDVIRQYTDERYMNPETKRKWWCDFYIPSKDLFIECNYSWVHGGRPFDENDQDCLDTLEFWCERAQVSKYTKQAIYVWTVLDPMKREVAKKNKLNFMEIY